MRSFAAGSQWRCRLKIGLLIGCSVTAVCMLQRLVAAPVYNAGLAQTWLAPLNALSGLLLIPGRAVAFQLIPPANHHDSPATMAISFVATLILYTGLTTLLAPKKSAAPPPPADDSDELLTRRKFLRVGAARAAGIAAVGSVGGLTAYASLLEPKLLPVTHTTHLIHDLPPELDGLRIVQLSDIHHGQWIPLNFVDRMVRAANALQPDLIFLNGDYVAGSRRFIRPVVQVLAGLRARIGVLGVLGNHDWWEGAGETRDCFKAAEIPLIDNSSRFLTTDRRLVTTAPRTGLCLGGVGDLWEDEVDVAAALRGAPDDMPRLLLSHNPDVAEMEEIAAGKVRIDLMLSGHTHGGQVYIPFLGTPIVPSSYGQKYAQGLVDGPGCKVFITRGIGMTVLPIRIGVPPEIALHELRRATPGVA